MPAERLKCTFEKGGRINGPCTITKKMHRDILPLSLIEIRTPSDDEIQLMRIEAPRVIIPGLSNLFNFHGKTFAQAYRSNWITLNTAEMPVPEDVAVIGNTSIVIPDPTRGGTGKFIGKIEEEIIMDDPSTIFLGSPQQMRTLLSMSLGTENNEFENQVDIYTGRATENGICLSRTNPMELVIYEDGSWNIFILNCADVSYPFDEPNLALINHNLGNLFKSYVRTSYFHSQRMIFGKKAEELSS